MTRRTAGRSRFWLERCAAGRAARYLTVHPDDAICTIAVAPAPLFAGHGGGAALTLCRRAGLWTPPPDRPSPGRSRDEVARLRITTEHEDVSAGQRAVCRRNSGRHPLRPFVPAARCAPSFADGGDLSDRPGRTSGRDRVIGPGLATDHDQFAPISPEIRTWAGTPENKLKVGCCASADGWKPEAVEYDLAADHYRVRIDGEWHDVAADAVLDGPNKFGLAMVWYYRTYLNAEKSAVYIRCSPARSRRVGSGAWGLGCLSGRRLIDADGVDRVAFECGDRGHSDALERVVNPRSADQGRRCRKPLRQLTHRRTTPSNSPSPRRGRTRWPSWEWPSSKPPRNSRS
jgi:hypothetical protein